jgi:hypothetical protein
MIMERVRASNVLVLETNHDVQMLQDDPRRPWSLKQRILSRHGHLSNEAAAEVAEQICSADLRHIFLGHLSRDCNTPKLANDAVSGRLQKIGANHISVHVTAQETLCPTLHLEEIPVVAEIPDALKETFAQTLAAPATPSPVSERIVLGQQSLF